MLFGGLWLPLGEADVEIDIIAEQLMASSFHLSIIYHLSLTVIVHHLTFSVLNSSVNFNFLIFGAKLVGYHIGCTVGNFSPYLRSCYYLPKY